MAEGEEESPRSTVAKTSRPDLPAQVESQRVFFCFVFPERSGDAPQQTGGKTERKREGERRKLERKPGEGILQA